MSIRDAYIQKPGRTTTINRHEISMNKHIRLTVRTKWQVGGTSARPHDQACTIDDKMPIIKATSSAGTIVSE